MCKSADLRTNLNHHTPALFVTSTNVILRLCSGSYSSFIEVLLALIVCLNPCSVYDLNCIHSDNCVLINVLKPKNNKSTISFSDALTYKFVISIFNNVCNGENRPTVFACSEVSESTKFTVRLAAISIDLDLHVTDLMDIDVFE